MQSIKILQVDFVVVVFQQQSNVGLPCSGKLVPTLQRLKKCGLYFQNHRVLCWTTQGVSITDFLFDTLTRRTDPRDHTLYSTIILCCQ